MQASSDESRVLVIYTGGTIGMLAGSDGFVPEPFFLTESLRKESRFHDPYDDSLFSRASTVANFREWSSNSGNTSPAKGATPLPPPKSQEPSKLDDLPTLLVRSSRPIEQPPSHVGTSQHLSWSLGNECFEAYLPSLITPKTSNQGGNNKRIRYAVLEWQPLLDSSNMEFNDWIRIATEIELNYRNFDAFVVLHGTDTMGYTSSALSFLLEDLGKTVIITGAQIPLSQLRNDAVDNVLGALTIAGQYIIPECCLYFDHTLYRGNRVTKSSSYDLDAFSSPNFPPLVNVGIDIVINWNHVMRPKSQRKFNAHKTLCPNVVPLRIFPGITAATVKAFLAPHIQGVVLESFGAGNAPQRKDLMDAFREACSRGVVVVTISQCARGTVSDSYETGRALLNTGVIPGGDMTPQCALTKLAYLLSKPELSIDHVRRLIRTPIRGELTLPTTLTPAGSPSTGLESVSDLLNQVLRISGSKPPPSSAIPSITVGGPVKDKSDTGVKDSVAPWSQTASDTASTESTLLPFLMHLAASRDDVEGIKFCIEADDQLFTRIASGASGSNPNTGGQGGAWVATSEARTVPGGVVNCMDATTRMTPLHVAALNGSLEAVQVLLECGALVHQRDLLDHTPLYYAARQGHANIVKCLVKAGAHFGGSDVSHGFTGLATSRAAAAGDEAALAVWKSAGVEVEAEE